MQTLEAGSPKRLSVGPSPAQRASGFTLIELLVVLAIVAIASAGVVLTLRDSTVTDLERDAQRLSAVLASSRAQSRMQGTPVWWRPSPTGFLIDGLQPPQAAQTWLSPDTKSTSPAVVLGPEPVIEAQTIVLESRRQTATRIQLSTDGLRPFAVIRP
ncbi:MAG: prepilin-type N-terminal cleavage/methylation domain-containing protein [Comamonadaceae bacterium]